MNQEQIDKLAEALRSQGLTWSQTNFAVSLVRNGADAERERCALIARHGCLVPPDGGSPTEDERLLGEEIERRIRAA